MRLTPSQAETITKLATDCFGQSARVWLFGSRVDDQARGGDIDLMVEVDDLDADSAMTSKLLLLKQLRLALGDQKIDLVVRRSGSSLDLPIHDVARSTGVRLQ